LSGRGKGRHAPHRRIVQQEAEEARRQGAEDTAESARKAARPEPPQQVPAYHVIDICFEGIDRDSLIINRRQFPAHMRADLQPAFEELFVKDADYVVGVLPAYHFDRLSFAKLMHRDRREPVAIGPLQYADVDIGEVNPARCFENALVLRDSAQVPHAAFLMHMLEHGENRC
jgi:hypothetical protein